MWKPQNETSIDRSTLKLIEWNRSINFLPAFDATVARVDLLES